MILLAKNVFMHLNLIIPIIVLVFSQTQCILVMVKCTVSGEKTNYITGITNSLPAGRVDLQREARHLRCLGMKPRNFSNKSRYSLQWGGFVFDYTMQKLILETVSNWDDKTLENEVSLKFISPGLKVINSQINLILIAYKCSTSCKTGWSVFTNHYRYSSTYFKADA